MPVVPQKRILYMCASSIDMFALLWFRPLVPLAVALVLLFMCGDQVRLPTSPSLSLTYKMDA